MTPGQLLAARFAALADGDFAVVYATYHQDSPFIKQFAGRSNYIRFAEQNLSEISVLHWQVLCCRELDAQRQEHLLVMELEVDGCRQYLYELALLIENDDGWRYHSAQKLAAEDYSGPPEQIQFAHFDQVEQKIRY
jgi:SEC-C motif-containing protein